jgi:L-asparaginase
LQHRAWDEREPSFILWALWKKRLELQAHWRFGALLGNGVKGIVSAGSGAGALSDLERNAVKAILSSPSGAKPVIVRSNRTGTGRVVPRKECDELGYVAADTLNPQKSRILLMLALTRTNDINEIRRMFSEY